LKRIYCNLDKEARRKFWWVFHLSSRLNNLLRRSLERITAESGSVFVAKGRILLSIYNENDCQQVPVDNQPQPVDKTQKCNVSPMGFTFCMGNRHNLQLPVMSCQYKNIPVCSMFETDNHIQGKNNCNKVDNSTGKQDNPSKKAKAGFFFKAIPVATRRRVKPLYDVIR